MNTTMNTVNQIFDWSRFTATLRKEVVENWRPIVFTLLGVYGLLTMFMILGNAISFDDAVSDAMSEGMVPQKAVSHRQSEHNNAAAARTACRFSLSGSG